MAFKPPFLLPPVATGEHLFDSALSRIHICRDYDAHEVISVRYDVRLGGYSERCA